ncbi:MAG: hypothetical protein IKI84_12900 [Clostridia bacterium]|nr:hypothetical protein [Clostridia bacterium]
MNGTEIEAFVFNNGAYTSLDSLVNAMGQEWMAGRKILFDGTLREHIKKTQPALAGACAAAEKEYLDKNNEGNRIYFRWLCSYPGIRSMYWRGRDLGGLDAIAAKLESGDEEVRKLVLYLMKEQVFHNMVLSLGGRDELSAQVRYLERAYNKRDTAFEREGVVPMLERVLRGEKTFVFEGRSFLSPKDLAAYLQGYADRSPKTLAKAVRALFADENNLDPWFESWILMHGFQHELTLWKVRYQEGRGDKDDGPEDFVFDEDREPLIAAREQTPEAFALEVEGFDNRFVELLTRFADRISDPKIFEGLMSDYFPENRLQCYLLLKLYRMEIMRAIRDAEEIDLILTARFEKRLTDDFGVGAAFAGWAVATWCRCYGEKVLNKKSTAHTE